MNNRAGVIFSSFKMILIAFSSGGCVHKQTDPGMTALKRATIFDGIGAEPIHNGVIVIDGQHIKCIGQ